MPCAMKEYTPKMTGKEKYVPFVDEKFPKQIARIFCEFLMRKIGKTDGVDSSQKRSDKTPDASIRPSTAFRMRLSGTVRDSFFRSKLHIFIVVR